MPLHESDSDAALWELAKVLYLKMEHLAPEGVDWDDAPDDEKEFCYYCASAIVRRLDLVSQYYGWAPARNDKMGGHSKVGKKPDSDKK